MHEQRNPRDGAGGPRPEGVRAYTAMNTVRALEHLARAPHSAPQLAAALQIGVRSARALLQRLQLEGYVVARGGYRRRYHPTLRLAVVGRRALEAAMLPRLASPHLVRLATATSCSAHLWIAADDGVMCVLQATATTDKTLTVPAAVLMLGEIDQDCSSPAACVLRYAPQRASIHASGDDGAASAAPILERDTVVAAVGIAGPHTVEALAMVQRTAQELSRELAG